LRAVYFRTFS